MAKRRSKKRAYKNIDILIIIAVVGVVLFLIISNREKKLRFIKYDAFGIELPTSFDIHGIDVSRYQQDINWQAVKEMEHKGVKIGFAFIKATEGVDNRDVYFKSNWKEASKQKLTKGAYHYFIPTVSPIAQANNFIKTVSLSVGDLPPVLDIEQTNGVPLKELQKRALQWLQIVENHYHIKPVIYTNADFYEAYLGASFDEYPLWVAHYYEKQKPRVKREWQFWQHNDGGNVNGIKSKVDFNVFKGDSTDLRNLLVR